jgi:hypothetical protein
MATLHWLIQASIFLASALIAGASALAAIVTENAVLYVPTAVTLLGIAIGAKATIIARNTPVHDPAPTPVASPQPCPQSKTPVPTPRRETPPRLIQDRTTLDEDLREALNTGLQLRQRLPAPLHAGLRGAAWPTTTGDDVIAWEWGVRDLLHGHATQQAVFMSEPSPYDLYSGAIPSLEFHRRLSYRLDTLDEIIRHLAA